jgi:hypothetical protein
MHEHTINLHMHTQYSDGHASHKEIAEAALNAKLDAVIVTDHNVLVRGPEGYFQEGPDKVLMIIGEEVHDTSRQPQKNHLLVMGTGRELAPLAQDPQRLVNGVQEVGGLSFIAHPIEYAAPAVDEPDISWVDWDVDGFTGIELWNAMSEFKSLLRSKLHAIFYAFNPHLVARGPFEKSLRKWDELLSKGRPVVAIGGSDAHALPASMGPLKRTIFPYQFHFQTVNTHIVTPQPLSGDYEHDRGLVMAALRDGRAFVGYDLPHPTRGFRFTAQGKSGINWMGSEIPAKEGATLQIRLPRRTECHLIRDGKKIKEWKQRETCTHITSQPGVYRVEVYLHYRGRRRGWIFSNPIYLR